MDAIKHFSKESMLSVAERASFMKNFRPPFCHDITKYKKVAKIGQGTYGVVYKAYDRNHTNKSTFVALKKILTFGDTDDFPLSALREIQILKTVQHKNIIRLIEVCRNTPIGSAYIPGFYLVFDFCEHDLAGILANRNVKLSNAEIKHLLLQLFEAICFLHSKNIIHRDLKTSNVLITKTGVLKLGDFGLARTLANSKGWLRNTDYNKENIPRHYTHKMNASTRKKQCYTNMVVTLWYRSPELLLGETNYGPEVDMWSVGCIVGEMWTRSALLPGKTEQEQLICISNLCGSLTPAVWPRISELELYNKIKLPRNCIRKLHQHLRQHIQDHTAIELLDKLLTLDPSKRINAREALNHKFIMSGVMPKSMQSTLAKHPVSMYTQSLEIIEKVSTNQPKTMAVVPHVSRTHRNPPDDTCTSFQDLIF